MKFMMRKLRIFQLHDLSDNVKAILLARDELFDDQADPKYNGYPVLGPFKYRDGSIYWGQFKEGIKEGVGKMTKDDGSIFIGHFEKGEKTEGLLTFESGYVYKGSFRNDLQEGKGLEIQSDGTVYKGDFKVGTKEGTGTLYYTDGTKYSGGLRSGKKEGEGKQPWHRSCPAATRRQADA